jgi:hypothetical protein
MGVDGIRWGWGVSLWFCIEFDFVWRFCMEAWPANCARWESASASFWLALDSQFTVGVETTQRVRGALDSDVPVFAIKDSSRQLALPQKYDSLSELFTLCIPLSQLLKKVLIVYPKNSKLVRSWYRISLNPFTTQPGYATHPGPVRRLSSCG